VTHDQSEALALSDLIVVMNQGRVEQVGTPAELYRKPANRFVADFVGEANLLPGRYANGHLTIGPLRFPFRQEGLADGPVTVMARPEAITVRKDGEGLPGQVRSAFFMGMTIEYLIETPAGEVTVVEPLGTWGAITAGAAVRLRFLEAGLYLLPSAE
jgi:iron(III) transport system ATP-binding protein